MSTTRLQASRKAFTVDKDMFDGSIRVTRWSAMASLLSGDLQLIDGHSERAGVALEVGGRGRGLGRRRLERPQQARAQDGQERPKVVQERGAGSGTRKVALYYMSYIFKAFLY